MTYWTIRDAVKEPGKIYTCAFCQIEYMGIRNPTIDDWKKCPNCGEFFNHEYDLYNGQRIKEEEVTAVEPGPTKDIVILSIEKYDEMRDELYSIQERFDNAVKERDRYKDILEMMGFQEKYIDRIVPDSARFVDSERNPVTLNKRVSISFELRED